jgi:RNA polymerase sigma-70 factor (ECF subfamily)
MNVFGVDEGVDEGVDGVVDAVVDEVVQQLVEGRARFLAFIRSRLDDAELAEDILQDSLLRALHAAPSLHRTDRLIPWFYTVLRNAIVDAYRRRSGESARLVPLADLDPAAESTSDRELCECFEPLLATLTSDQADLLRRLDLANEPSDSVARSLGISPGTLRVRRHRARQALRRRLDETCRTCAEHGCLDCTCRLP